MSSLLPFRSEPTVGERDPRVVELEGEDADAVFGALSSATARRIVAYLHEEPRTQSDLAEAVDTSVQNVRYHLDKLEAAGLVEVVDTWYSSRGNEMKVYAPADGALIVSGDESRASRLRRVLSGLVGGLFVLALASLAVGRVVRDSFSGGGKSSRASDAGEAEVFAAKENVSTDAAPSAAEESATEATRAETVEPVTNGGAKADEATRTAADGGVDAVAASDAIGVFPPELLFFLGGASVLLVVVGLWYYRTRR
jgi:DNA-binding transcriptional ArsR family regulator